jgi:hypothetical protein
MNDPVDLPSVVEIKIWCSVSGKPYVSFFDKDGREFLTRHPTPQRSITIIPEWGTGPEYKILEEQ